MNIFKETGRQGAVIRWGLNRPESKTIRVHASTVEKLKRAIPRDDRVEFASRAIEEALARRV